MGTFVTQTADPVLFAPKVPAPGAVIPVGLTVQNVTQAADLNAINDALHDCRDAIRATVYDGTADILAASLTVNAGTLHVDSVDGRVGVGTTTPTRTLDVSGAVAVSGNVTVDIDTLHVDALNGRVGVGTAAPTFTLDVVGDANIDGTASVTGGLAVDGATLYVDAGAHMVGVNTATPSQALDVAGNAHVSGALAAGSAAVSGAVVAGSAVVTGSLSVDTNVLFVSATTNRVGVNNAAPTQALDVAGNAVVSGSVTAASAVVTGALTVDTTTLHVDATTNRVGVGTTSPTQALDVTGNARLTGKLLLPSGDTTGTPGSVTLNAPTGRAAIANGATTCVVTNSFVVATSTVLVTPMDLGAAGFRYAVSVAAGAFTVTGSAASVGAWRFAFLVVN